MNNLFKSSLGDRDWNSWHSQKTLPRHLIRKNTKAAFTRTELLVVIAGLGLLAMTQIAAVSRSKSPVGFTRCMNNLRQMGQATMIYVSEIDGIFPFGQRINGPGVVDSAGWPMQLLRYMGNDTNHPSVYLCPQESEVAENWAFQLHYMANRCVISDIDDLPSGIPMAKLDTPSIYWLVMEKAPNMIASIRPGSFVALGATYAWNIPPGLPWMRRHNGGFTAVACDGHVDWLRPPPFHPGAPPPSGLGELGDTSDGRNPASSWIDDGLPKKLYCRKRQSAAGLPSF